MSKKHRPAVKSKPTKPAPKPTAKQAKPAVQPEVEPAPKPQKAKKRPVEAVDASPSTAEPLPESTELPTALPLAAFTDAVDETPDAATNAPAPEVEAEPQPAAATATATATVPAQSPLFALCSRRVKATGHLLPDNRFIVAAGSTAVLADAPSFKGKLRQQLRDDGILVPNGDLLMFATEHTFESPSSAATAVAGSNQNGLTAWKHDKKPLKDFRAGIVRASAATPV